MTSDQQPFVCLSVQSQGPLGLVMTSKVSDSQLNFSPGTDLSTLGSLCLLCVQIDQKSVPGEKCVLPWQLFLGTKWKQLVQKYTGKWVLCQESHTKVCIPTQDLTRSVKTKARCARCLALAPLAWEWKCNWSNYTCSHVYFFSDMARPAFLVS